MANTSNDPARAALLAFLRSTFTKLANNLQKDSMELRAVLRTLR